jgi:outer membrane receptor protein involved in Fe transport
VHYRPTPAWDVSASYLYNDSEVLKFPADPSLQGKRVPQVPPHTFTLGVQYLQPRLANIAVQGRFVSDQFEDDRNENDLGDFFVVDLTMWRPIPLPYAAASEIFVAVENLFDTTYAAGKDPATGVVSIGTPLLLHGGIRFRF